MNGRMRPSRWVVRCHFGRWAIERTISPYVRYLVVLAETLALGFGKALVGVRFFTEKPDSDMTRDLRVSQVAVRKGFTWVWHESCCWSGMKRRSIMTTRSVLRNYRTPWLGAAGALALAGATVSADVKRLAKITLTLAGLVLVAGVASAGGVHGGGFAATDTDEPASIGGGYEMLSDLGDGYLAAGGHDSGNSIGQERGG